MSKRLRGIIWGRTRRRASSPADFLTPAQAANVVLWLAADDAAIVITGAGISSWPNKMGAASAATQATDAARPTVVPSVLNNLPAVRFASQHVKGTGVISGTDFSCFGVFNLANLVNASTAVAFAPAGVASSGLAGYTPIRRAGTSSAVTGRMNNVTTTGSAVTYGTPFIWSILTNATTVSRVTNGAITLLTDAITCSFNTTIYAIGGDLTSGGVVGTAFWSADVHEVIVMAGEASTGVRQNFEGYLAHKWGLAGSLPSAHPYKAAPP